MKSTILISAVLLCGAAWAQDLWAQDPGARTDAATRVQAVDASASASVDASVHAGVVDARAEQAAASTAAARRNANANSSVSFQQMPKAVGTVPSSLPSQKSAGGTETGPNASAAPSTSASGSPSSSFSARPTPSVAMWPSRYQEPAPVPAADSRKSLKPSPWANPQTSPANSPNGASTASSEGKTTESKTRKPQWADVALPEEPASPGAFGRTPELNAHPLSSGSGLAAPLASPWDTDGLPAPAASVRRARSQQKRRKQAAKQNGLTQTDHSALKPSASPLTPHSHSPLASSTPQK